MMGGLLRKGRFLRAGRGRLFSFGEQLAQENFRKNIVASSTVTADATTAVFKVGARYNAFIGMVKVGTVAGTSPTLNVYVQGGMLMEDGTYTWTDYASFKQLTSSNTEAWLRKHATGSGEESHNASDGALTAEAIREGPIPSTIRCKVDVGGTSPSFGTCEITLEFYNVP